MTRAIITIHRTARFIGDDTALVSEIAGDRVTREYPLPMRNFTAAKQHEMLVNVVVGQGVRL